MLLVLITVLGLVVILQLFGISGRLEASRLATEQLRKEFQRFAEISSKSLVKELQWFEDHTFAHELRGWIETASKDIVEELQWFKDGAFAHELMGWIEGSAKDIVDELEWHKDLTFAHELMERVETATGDILKALREIQRNTSHEDNADHFFK